jgi:outer membrane protein OmpA-like peptidoglycan-associated protein
MAQFCTRCGKPLYAGVRFCPSCGGAVTAPAAEASGPCVTSAPAAAPFAPIGVGVESQQAASSVAESAWTAVSATASPDISIAEPAQFAPVEAPAFPQQASVSSQGQARAWTAVASADAPAASASAATASQPGSFTPVPISNEPSSSNSQWSQTAAASVPRRRSVWPKVIGAALVLILLVGATVVGGVIYVGYKVRQKARVVTQNLSHLADDKGVSSLTKNGSQGAKSGLVGLFDALAGKAGADGNAVLSSGDPVTPCSVSAFVAQDTARVPFKPGTVLTTAWGVKYGDVEATNTIDSIDSSTVRTTNRTGEYKDDNGQMSKALTITNQNCNSDYLSAENYMTVNARQLPALLHNLTRFRLSDKAFQEIKSNGRTNFTYADIYYVPKGVKLTHQGGTLTRVEPEDVKYPMIVNDQRVDLPVIHLKGTMIVPDKDPRPARQRPKQSDGELFVLDDAADPLVLNWKLKDPLFHSGNFRVEVVKINFPVAKPENVLEKQLVEQKRAVTYGIYFDFNKDTLKPESEPVLKEIAQTMTDNPDWKLTVEGHTDNVGGDAYNLELSKRRAAAVKQALVSQCNISPERLLTGGFGASRPIETNDTLEGRARNRRVELVRD